MTSAKWPRITIKPEHNPAGLIIIPQDDCRGCRLTTTQQGGVSVCQGWWIDSWAVSLDGHQRRAGKGMPRLIDEHPCCALDYGGVRTNPQNTNKGHAHLPQPINYTHSHNRSSEIRERNGDLLLSLSAQIESDWHIIKRHRKNGKTALTYISCSFLKPPELGKSHKMTNTLKCPCYTIHVYLP